MIDVLEKNSCTGCEACVSVCPHNCIDFLQDSEGFFYPKIDKNICIECGKCQMVCPVINQMQPNNDFKIFGAKNRNSEILKSSSSGGIFTLLSEKILEQNGVVFGAKFDENWQVVHSQIDQIDQLSFLRGAKYVQSKIGESFIRVKEQLKSGKLVLFSGTPCQVAGLRLFLRREYKNLILVDFICHGTPSPAVWSLYLSEITHKNGIVKVDDIKFRDKRKGWKNYQFSLFGVRKDGKKRDLHRYFKQVSYMQGFLNNLYLRPSCYDCPVKGGRSGSDITIADFWGLKKLLPHFNDNSGVSLLVLNSAKGVDYFENIDNSKIEKIETSKAALQKSFFESSKKHKDREHFFYEFTNNKQPLITLISKYCKNPLSKRIKNTFFGQL